MRTKLVVVVVVVLAVFLAGAGNARDNTKLTVDQIAAVRMVGYVYWEGCQIWKFQVFSGPNTPSQVLVVPPGATIKYFLDAIGSDKGKPIRVSVDQGKGEQLVDSELSYYAEQDDTIICRTVYVGAVREDRPLFKFIVGFGSKVSHADTKGVWIFPINTTETFPVKCPEQAIQAMLLAKSAGTPVGIDLPAVNAPAQPNVEKPATKQVFADGPATDRNFEKQGEINQTLLGRDERLADGLQALTQKDNNQDARISRLEQGWDAQAKPQTAPSDLPSTLSQKSQTLLKEELLAKYAGQCVVVMALQSGSGIFRYFLRRANDWQIVEGMKVRKWTRFKDPLSVSAGDEELWKTVAKYVGQGYCEFGIAPDDGRSEPTKPHPLDPRSLCVVILDGGG